MTVIGSTNEPWAIDESFLRPGRLGRCIYLGVLDSEGRHELLRSLIVREVESVSGRADITLNMYSVEDLFNLPSLVERTDGFTGADVKLLYQKAKLKLKYTQRNDSESDSNNDINIDSNDDVNSIDFICRIIPSYGMFSEVLKTMKASVLKEECDEYQEWFNYKFGIV